MRLEDLPAGRYPGGVLVSAALETAGISHTFGIPGTHNIELYDALHRNPAVTPVLVTHEQSAGFIADGMARSGGPIACANVVPGPGLTHLLSGVGEAFMDHVPMLVLACGVRNDTGHHHQLHDVDQLSVVRPLCKAASRVERGADIPLAILEAVALAKSGCPGPVAIEIPGNHYLFRHPHDPQRIRAWLEDRAAGEKGTTDPDPEDVAAVAELLLRSRRPLLHVGLGCAGASDLLVPLAERVGAVVSTTFSGKGVFPENHPQWLWPGTGRSCPAPLRRIAARCDAALVLGARLSEVSTASYGLVLPSPTVQVDIDPQALGANYPLARGVHADARRFLIALHRALNLAPEEGMGDVVSLRRELAAAHVQVTHKQASTKSPDRVTPDVLFRGLQAHFKAGTRFVTDSGKGTFLAVEHLRLQGPRQLLSPTDYSSMGYGVPAAIGAALAHPGRPVVAVVGDGALLMTGLEMITARHLGLPIALVVLRDGELGQISRFQRDVTTDTPCTTLPSYDAHALAAVAGVPSLSIDTDADVGPGLREALERVQAGGPVLVEVAIDYSRRTWFTQGVVRTNFGRLPWKERLRLVGRTVSRRTLPRQGAP